MQNVERTDSSNDITRAATAMGLRGGDSIFVGECGARFGE